MISRRILLDVDGVLADFVGHLIECADLPLTREEINDWHFFELLSEDDLRRTSEVLEDVNFWRTQPVIAGAQAAVEEMRRRDQDLLFVTSPWKDCPGWMHARHAWLAEHFDVPRDHIVVTSAKHRVIGDILVDDAPHNILDFSRDHGRQSVIVFDAPYNRHLADFNRLLSWDVFLAYCEENFDG